MVPTQLEDVICEVLESQTILANEKGLELIEKVEPGLPPVMADADAMNQMAVNIISNSIKFTESPGQIEVALFLREGGVILEVPDTGLGIPEEDLPNILGKFYRVDREKREDQGTGIGLAIVKEVIERHGAIHEIESEVGKGTTFRVIIPV